MSKIDGGHLSYRNRYHRSVDLVKHLRYFLVVAEELHFGRAAERLGMAQPPLSQRIKGLERELAVELFDRSGRRVRLTAAGELLRQEATDVIGRVDRMILVLDKAKRGEFGALRAGVPPDTSAATLAALMTEFGESHLDVRLDLHELSTPEQLRQLSDRQLDVGLVAHPVDATDLVLGPAVETELGVVLPRSSPLARRPELALGDLAGHGLVLFPRAEAPGRYDSVLQACRANGFDPIAVHHARNPEFVLGLVLTGHGVTFDQMSLARNESRVVWRPLVGHGMTWVSSTAWPVSNPHPAAEFFAKAVAEVFSRKVSTSDKNGERPWTVVFPPYRSK